MGEADTSGFLGHLHSYVHADTQTHNEKIKLNTLTTERIPGLENKPHRGESGGGVDDPRPATLKLTTGSIVGQDLKKGWSGYAPDAPLVEQAEHPPGG